MLSSFMATTTMSELGSLGRAVSRMRQS